ncbi:hypothetical protein [Cyanothece sp. BG0011]|uniref:hypothetical protein n=1 Tax=Cyanothece sp. BG0011 TaxID=2082950 RepID=UPI000D1EDEF2|nr:hypothetical protein [Cyanothece sp. BG0011]
MTSEKFYLGKFHLDDDAHGTVEEELNSKLIIRLSHEEKEYTVIIESFNKRLLLRVYLEGEEVAEEPIEVLNLTQLALSKLEDSDNV